MAKKSFESALARLEELNRELERGDLSLEITLKKFEEGVGLARFCSEQLSEAKARVDILLEKDGGFQAEPFSERDGEDGY
ncbi:MAG: exodeoxyribonuclease VII small subunit [Desulfobulbaceae bacterium]|jgi:exodeoxyribonuclease VII small subunit|nr:exodeoxyribonuclease VII small subunit [Desulfobulbaceae bacterium]